MLVPGDHPPDVDALLVEFEEADGAVRALYRELGADPDLAGEYEPRLKDLHARRLDLAQRVGLASLARRRTWAVTAATPQVGPEPTAPLAEATATSPPPVLGLGEPEGPPSTPVGRPTVNYPEECLSSAPTTWTLRPGARMGAVRGVVRVQRLALTSGLARRHRPGGGLRHLPGCQRAQRCGGRACASSRERRKE
jgi:hypothetical protein